LGVRPNRAHSTAILWADSGSNSRTTGIMGSANWRMSHSCGTTPFMAATAAAAAPPPMARYAAVCKEEEEPLLELLNDACCANARREARRTDREAARMRLGWWGCKLESDLWIWGRFAGFHTKYEQQTKMKQFIRHFAAAGRSKQADER
jgi:hypothetical protein